MIDNIDEIRINYDTEALWIVNITLAIIMFGIALDISKEDFTRLFKNPKVFFIGVISQFLLVPLTTLGLVYLLQPRPSIALGMFMVAACPGGNISNFMTKLAKGNTAFSVSLTGFATFASLLFTPLNLAIWANLYKPTSLILEKVSIEPLEVTKIVVLILAIPLIVGMFIRFKIPKKAIKLAKFIKPISVLILIIFILGALFENRTIFRENIHHVFYIVLIHNVTLYMVGFYFAKGSKLNYQNQKTLSIETGIQNSGLGLMLVFLFFNGIGGMALTVAFWGIWDIFSGLVLAYFWSRKKVVYEGE